MHCQALRRSHGNHRQRRALLILTCSWWLLHYIPYPYNANAVRYFLWNLCGSMSRRHNCLGKAPRRYAWSPACPFWPGLHKLHLRYPMQSCAVQILKVPFGARRSHVGGPKGIFLGKHVLVMRMHAMESSCSPSWTARLDNLFIEYCNFLSDTGQQCTLV